MLLGTQIKRRWCSECDRHVGALLDPSGATFHAMLTILTFGLWFPVFLWSFFRRCHKCPRCGSRV